MKTGMRTSEMRRVARVVGCLMFEESPVIELVMLAGLEGFDPSNFKGLTRKHRREAQERRSKSTLRSNQYPKSTASR